MKEVVELAQRSAIVVARIRRLRAKILQQTLNDLEYLVLGAEVDVALAEQLEDERDGLGEAGAAAIRVVLLRWDLESVQFVLERLEDNFQEKGKKTKFSNQC